MSQSRKEWVDDANMRRSRKAKIRRSRKARIRRSRKAPVDNDTLGTFVAYHCQPNWSFEFLKNKFLTAVQEDVLSLADTKLMRAPNPKSVSAVQAWLRSHGIQDIDTKGDWVNVRATVGQTDALIGSLLEHYIYHGEDRPVLHTTQYFIPDALEDAIDFIHPVSNFMRPVRSLSKIKWLNETDLTKRDPPCTSVITPKCVREAYNFYYRTPDDNSSVTMGVAGFLEQYANYQDSDHSSTVARNSPALLYTNTISLLEREAYRLLPEIQLDLRSKRQVCRIISAAALLKICAGKSQPEVQKIVERFTSLCMETTLEHLEHALKICDRIQQMSYVDNEVGVPLRKMSLKDGEVALDQAIQV
ncbi:hypothetical protein ARSEF4850_005039 [Beauveria asiatica]